MTGWVDSSLDNTRNWGVVVGIFIQVYPQVVVCILRQQAKHTYPTSRARSSASSAQKDDQHSTPHPQSTPAH